MSEKLVRDNIPKQKTIDGEAFKVRVGTLEEKEPLLLDKLREEVEELAAAEYPNRQAEEWADIMEVVAALMRAQDIDPVEVEEIRKEKAKRSGRFTKIYVLTTS